MNCSGASANGRAQRSLDTGRGSDRAVEEVKVLTEKRDGAHASVEKVRKPVESARIEFAARSAEVSAQSSELSVDRHELAATRTEIARICDVL